MDYWDLKGKKVLIVDDFQDMRSMIRSMVDPLSPELTRIARDGQEAMEYLEENSFDIVFCDYDLGKGKDGQEVLEEAKQRDLLPYSAIFILVTAESTSRMVMGAMDYLPDDYISKPFNRSVLQKRLKRLLDKKDGMMAIAQAMSEKNYVKALTHCDQQLAQKPRNIIDILKSKGELLLLLGKYDDAANLYEKLLESRDIPWAQLALGKARYHQQDYFEAEEIFEDLIRENSANVSAHDWLAKTLEKQGDQQRAQDMLSKAVAISPKSIVRQRQLAELAAKNEDFETSEAAYKQAVENGRYSCYREADDYTRLLSTLLKKDDKNAASGVLEKLKKEFDKKDVDSNYQFSVAQAQLCEANNDREGAEKAITEALKISSSNPQVMTLESSLELTDLCLHHGRKDEASEISKHLIRNNHDNDQLLSRTKELYEKAGYGNEGGQLVDSAREEVIKVNNQGAKLLKEGRLEESIDLFIKASRGMPDNPVVTINVAISLIKQMQKTGKVNKYMSRTMKYIDKLREIDPQHPKYFDLMAMVHKLSNNDKAA